MAKKAKKSMFTVRFHVDTSDYCDVDVEAASPQEALQKALDGEVDTDGWEATDSYGEETPSYVMDQEGQILLTMEDLEIEKVLAAEDEPARKLAEGYLGIASQLYKLHQALQLPGTSKRARRLSLLAVVRCDQALQRLGNDLDELVRQLRLGLGKKEEPQ